MKPELLRLRVNQLTSNATDHAYYLYARELSGMKPNDYATWLAVDSFSLGSATATASGGAGAHHRGGSHARRSLNDLSITTFAAPASPQIMIHLTSGKPFDKVLLDVVGKKGDVFRMTMEYVFVTSYATQKDASGRDLDTFSLNFKTIAFLYG